ncbi:hypothetical protein BJX64DRAFT_293112 [Aspergillus heterothallicus]
MSRPINDSDRARVVLQIRVTMHTMGYIFEADTRSGNHVSIFLLIGDRESVRLNMIKKGPTNTKGTLQISMCEYVVSSSAVKNRNFPAPPGRTVGDFFDTLTRKGCHNYQLSRSGVGCRFWVSTVMEDYERALYLVSTANLNATSLKEALQYNYSRNQAPGYEPMIPGTFL